MDDWRRRVWAAPQRKPARQAFLSGPPAVRPLGRPPPLFRLMDTGEMVDRAGLFGD